MKTKRLIMDCDDCYRAEIAQLKQSNAELLRALQVAEPLLKIVTGGNNPYCECSHCKALATVRAAITSATSNQPT